MLSTQSHPSPSSISPKRYNLDNTICNPDIMSNRMSDQETEAAVLALTNLAENQNRKSLVTASDISENIQPKIVHLPPHNALMVDHTYSDYSSITEDFLSVLEPDEDMDGKLTDEEKGNQEKKLNRLRLIFGDIAPTRKSSGGVVKPFPERFMEVLQRPDMEHIVCWLPHGRAFIVLNTQQLCDVVLPRFFKQSKFMSFTRQLNLWGFKRITKGVDAGAYYHELFLRGRPRLCLLMRRQKIKGIGIKLSPNPDNEPDFYKISEKYPLPVTKSSDKDVSPLPPLSHNGLAKSGNVGATVPGFPTVNLQQQPQPTDIGPGMFGNSTPFANIDLNLLLRQHQSMEQQGKLFSIQNLLQSIQNGGFSGINMNAIDELKLHLMAATTNFNQQPILNNMNLHQQLVLQLSNQLLNNNNSNNGNLNLNLNNTTNLTQLAQALEYSRNVTAQIQARLQKLLSEGNRNLNYNSNI